ncbi:outer membrane beta-barrel protein [Bizionia myxarmorum]|uniref:Outer membrane beta-barrel protein n=1 Tax=Bizionia myxarmorum TaxID=291186 RepID=A0A5D0RFZ5_9FLAO|nr:outer membrane beta-barrel protein [Bizionia myxarmorum]TYB79841.1 outer membrane beta-barrel protein [Bizionia myxarmorum]
MKKLFMMAAIAAFGVSTSFAQNSFKVGANFALPIGDAGDYSSFSIGLDAAYLFEVSEKFQVGPAIGFTNAFGKTESVTILGNTLDFDYDDVQFVPIAAAARFMATEKFYLGADLGYALGVNDGNDGGFYYRPKVGYNFTDMIGANISYTGISADGGDFSTIGLGIEFSL